MNWDKLIERLIFKWMQRKVNSMGLQSLDMIASSYMGPVYSCHKNGECALNLKSITNVEGFAKLHHKEEESK